MTNLDASLREAQRLAETRGASDPYAAALRATRMPIVITDARLDDNPIVFANDAFVRLSGYGRDEIIGRNCRFLQGPQTDRDEVARVAAAIAAGRHVEAEILNYRKDGATFWNALFVSPVFDAAGGVTHFFGSQVDMTARIRAAADLARAKDDAEALVAARTHDLQSALDQKTVLLHEVDHRVKNNLQLISSLILLQARRIPDPEVRTTMKAMLNRVTALSTAHRHLFQSDDVAAFDVAALVRDLVSDLFEAHGRDDVRLRFELAPAVAPASQAAAIALVVNELATNALKHAFPGAGGEIRLGVRRRDDSLVVEVEDDGVGPIDPDGPNGFGLSLVELLGKQLSATIERDASRAGTTVRVAIPAAPG